MKGARNLTLPEVARVEERLAAERGLYWLRNLTLFRLGCRVGGRISELLQLRIGNVLDTVSGEVAPEVHFPRETTKGKREGRRVPISGDFREALAAYVSWLRAYHGTLALARDAWLFPSRKARGGQPGRLDRRSAHRILDAAFTAAGVGGRTGTHSVRKTAANVWLKGGASLVEVSDMLGHSDLKVTTRYLGVDEERMRAAAESLERLYREQAETPLVRIGEAG